MRVPTGKFITLIASIALFTVLMIQSFLSSSNPPRKEAVPATSLTAFFDLLTMLPSPTPPARGEAPPNFSLMGLDGQSHQLTDYRGKAIILNFWASWCAPCRSEMPLLQQTADQFSDKLVVIGINSGEDEQTTRAFMDKLSLNFPVLLDKDNGVGRKYSVFGLPTTFFIDANGILKDGSMGPLTTDTLKMYLDGINVTQS